jgi:CheY-like chemotaxis protein
VEEIRSAGARASDLTQQLLAFSRKQIIQPRRLDLNAELRSTQAIFVRLLGEDIEVIHDLAPSLEPVLADPGQMHQVVMNLVVNARDAMPGGGRLLIETRNVELSRDDVAEQQQVTPRCYVRLTVTDSGHGMAPETMARIFEPFFTTKAVGKGTGLGLSTVYGIVRQNRGMIKVASELGKGTRFIVHLPCAGSERAEEGAREDGAGSSRGSGTVLLVEDDPAVRQLTAEVLRHHGYRVLEADDGQKGADLGEAYAGQIDLLVADVVMPGLTGPQLAGRLNAARPEMKVLYVSGYTDEAFARHGVLEPGLRLLMKPFTPDTLVAIVQELLGTGLA